MSPAPTRPLALLVAAGLASAACGPFVDEYTRTSFATAAQVAPAGPLITGPVLSDGEFAIEGGLDAHLVQGGSNEWANRYTPLDGGAALMFGTDVAEVTARTSWASAASARGPRSPLLPQTRMTGDTTIAVRGLAGSRPLRGEIVGAVGFSVARLRRATDLEIDSTTCSYFTDECWRVVWTSKGVAHDRLRVLPIVGLQIGGRYEDAGPLSLGFGATLRVVPVLNAVAQVTWTETSADLLTSNEPPEGAGFFGGMGVSISPYADAGITVGDATFIAGVHGGFITPDLPQPSAGGHVAVRWTFRPKRDAPLSVVEPADAP